MASYDVGVRDGHGARSAPAADGCRDAQRRTQLLESALEVFVAQGYHAAAMDDIAERAGVSKPVLYQHFPGKLELYLALLDASCDTIIDNCRRALAATPTTSSGWRPPSPRSTTTSPTPGRSASCSSPT